MDKKESLNNAIIGSFNEFSKRKDMDKSSIIEWLNQSMINLYSDGDSKGFVIEFQDDLNLSKDDILDTLVSSYAKQVNNKEFDEIQDFFQKTLKTKIDSDGIEVGINAVKKYLETSDTATFGNIDESKLAQYSSQGLINVMCREYINNILQNPEKGLQKGKKSSTIPPKTKFEPYEIFGVGGTEKQYDIDTVAFALESIRAGKIQSLGVGRE